MTVPTTNKKPRARGEAREKVYRYVRDRILEGSAPTVREVQKAMGYGAVESARKQLDALVQDGRLLKDARRSRGFRLPPAAGGEQTVRVAMLESVDVESLTDAIADPAGYLVAESAHPATELFALRVRGDSMNGDGILSGDVVIVRRQQTIEPGSLVVARHDGKVMVRAYRAHGGKVVLDAAAAGVQPLTVEPSRVEIFGRVVEVRRRLDG